MRRGQGLEVTQRGIRAGVPTWAPLFMGFPSSHSTREAFSLDRHSGFSWSGERRRGQFGLLETPKTTPPCPGPHLRVQGPHS